MTCGLRKGSALKFGGNSLPSGDGADVRTLTTQPLTCQPATHIALFSEPLPLIVFGDHTRTFKFINQPFARGADGTQLLRPKSGIDPLFFFYACKAIDLPARGYNQHFTILKEKKLSYPDETGQKFIGGVLQRVE